MGQVAVLVHVAFDGQLIDRHGGRGGVLDDLAVAQDADSGQVVQGLALLDRLHDLEEGNLALGGHDGITFVMLEDLAGHERGVVPAHDDLGVGAQGTGALGHFLGGSPGVGVHGHAEYVGLHAAQLFIHLGPFGLVVVLVFRLVALLLEVTL